PADADGTASHFGRGRLWARLRAWVLRLFGLHRIRFRRSAAAPGIGRGPFRSAVNPVLTAVAASFVGERLTATKLVGFALASIGAGLVIAAGQTGDEISSRRFVGDLLMLLGAGCWAIYTVLGTIALRTRSPLAIVPIAAPIGALCLIPLGFLEKGYADVADWNATGWLNVLYLALVG